MGKERKGRTDLPITPRLRSIIRLSWEGLEDREIAARLDLAYKTVTFYWGRIYDRLGYTTMANPPACPRTAAAVWLWRDEQGTKAGETDGPRIGDRP